MFKEKPEIHASELLHNKPPALANLGFPKELPSVFNFIKGSSGAIHLIVVGILILVVLVRQAK